MTHEETMTTQTKVVTIVCGNGIVQTGEQCDDGNLINGDGCSSVCMIEGMLCGVLDR